MITDEELKERRKNHKCLLCGSDLDQETGNCIENPYHTEDPS